MVTVYSVRVGWGKIKTLNNNVKSASKVESILKEKEQELITYQGQLDSYVDISAGVLPEKNPALLVVTQLKKIALENNIFLEDLKISSQQVVKGEISDLKVNFKAMGVQGEVFNFLKTTKTVSPILKLDNLDFSSASGTASADVRLLSFFARFPENLPPMADPIQKLSENDLENINSLSTLTTPSFTSLSPNGPFERENPFSF